MPIEPSSTHFCEENKFPCQCFPKIELGKRAVIPDVLKHHEEFVEDQLRRAYVDDSAVILSIDGGFKISAAYNESSRPKRTALHIECSFCNQVWCYNGKDSLKTALRKHGLRNKEILGLSEEFDKIILALTDKETLIHQHTFWNSNPVQ